MSPFGFMLSADPPSRRTGVITALAAVALCTLIVYPLKHIAPVVALGVVYLPAVLVVSIAWGAWLGFLTAVISAAAFNFFQLPPTGQFTIKDSSNWVALATFVVVAVLSSSLAEITRARTRDAEERRREADLAAEMARVLLRGNSLNEALATAAARLAAMLSLTSAAIELESCRRRRAQRGVPTARRDPPAGDAAGRRGHLRAEPAQAAGARRAGAGGAAQRGARAGGAAGRGRGDGVAATGRCREDGAAARGLTRSALSPDGDLGGRRGGWVGCAARGRAQGDGGGDPGGGAQAVAAGRQPARPLASGGGRGRAAARVDLGRGGDRLRAGGVGSQGGGLRALDRPRSAAGEGRFRAAGARRS